MSKHIAGIKPLTAGYEKIEIKPQYDLHKSIFCTVPAEKVYISFGYKSENGKALINLEYPEDSQLVLHLPENAVVTANGRKVETESVLIIG